MTAEVLFETQATDSGAQLGVVYLNRPKALNALSLDMILALYERLTLWQGDPRIAAVVIRSTSEKAFCAGGDVRALYHNKSLPKAQKMDFFWHEYRLNTLIHHYSKPYISLLDGITMGGGVGISIHGSYPIASEKFVFAMPETTIGFFPDVGGSWILNQCPGASGLYLGLTGQSIKQSDAFDLGLIKYCIPSHQHQDVYQELISLDSISANSIEAIFTRYHRLGGSSQLDHQSIDRHFSKPSLQAIVESLKACDSEFAKNTYPLLMSKSPTSLEVCFEQLKRSESYTMKQCMAMEYRIVHQFMQPNSDFYEGVRALLVEKDKNPQWHPQYLNKIDRSEIEKYFQPIPKELAFDELDL